MSIELKNHELTDHEVNPTVGESNALSTKGMKIDRTAYLTNLVQLRNPTIVPWMQQKRDHASAIVQELAIPSSRDEDWRFTDLSALIATSFEAVTMRSALGFEQIQDYLLPECTNSRLVFVDGIYAADLSSIDDLPEETLVGNLAQVQEFLPQVGDHFAKQPGGEEVFTALNTASVVDGAIVWIPKDQTVSTPIHLLFIATGIADYLIQPRILVVVGSGSDVTLVEDYVKLNDSAYFTNSVAEIQLDSNAKVNHIRIQRDADSAFHIGKTAVTQARDSRYHGLAVNFGGTVVRHNWEVYSNGEQTHSELLGLSWITDDRTSDTHSLIAFSKPHCTAKQINKCIADDKSHGIFNGRICVPKLAQQTDAAQLSRSLLLSPKARIDTKPQLEIVADNVKCAHGATVSQLEDEAVFYLQSRGIDTDAARKLLTYAFATEVINEISIASLRTRLQAQVRSVHQI
jgi:Fe-S cluster assembly protein SufD